ncbi:MAG: ROK family protein [Myxococcota bacterium]|nr:ROK family protein [Myxococcota bacterium]
MRHYIGIDVGGTRLKAGLVDHNHRVIREEVAWLAEEDTTEDGILRRLTELVHALRGRTKPVIVGLGIPGVISRWDGMVTESPNFPAWTNFRIKERLEAVLGMHVAIDNDANCVIAGEALAGAAAGHRDLLGFTLGTGVGGAVILGGRLWHGRNGMAGELGHICVDPDGPLCGCGSHGCLETFASRVGLRHALINSPVSGIDPDAPDMPKLLAAKARSGEPVAIGHFAMAGTALGRATGGLLNVLNVGTILLTGGLLPAWPLMEAAMRAEMTRTAFAGVVEGVDILTGTLGDQAGMIGAALQWQLMPHD